MQLILNKRYFMKIWLSYLNNNWYAWNTMFKYTVFFYSGDPIIRDIQWKRIFYVGIAFKI